METKSLDIRSKSVEQTLVPLMSQITTLMNHKKATFKRSAIARKTLQEICAKVKEAILHFVKIGEEIAGDNPEFVADMSEACTEAKGAASMIGSLTDMPVNSEGETSPSDRADIIRASRALLSAVTRVLIITDMVVVKRLINAARKVDERLQALETVNNFTEFVQAFSHFGADMVELAHLSGDRQNDLKDDSSKAEMCAARTLLEKSTMMLLTTSKTFLRHPDSSSAKHNREGVFVKMRGAMNTITSVAQNSNCKREPRKGQLLLDLKSFDGQIKEKLPDADLSAMSKTAAGMWKRCSTHVRQDWRKEGQRVREDIDCGIINYECRKCAKSFRKAKHATYHEKTCGQCMCAICNKNFSGKVALLKHMNIHQEKFKCETCNKVFGTKYDLTRHAKVHSKVKDFACHTCNARFTTQSNKNRHAKNCV